MSQIINHCYMHTIFSSKDHQPLFKTQELRDQLKEFLYQKLKKLNAKAYAISISEDHIHLLHQMPVEASLDQLIAEIKLSSSLFLKKTGQVELGNFHWQKNYGSVSVSHSSLSGVSLFLQEQEELHKTVTYEKEFIAFLKKHHIDFDMQGLWD